MSHPLSSSPWRPSSFSLGLWCLACLECQTFFWLKAMTSMLMMTMMIMMMMTTIASPEYKPYMIRRTFLYFMKLNMDAWISGWVSGWLIDWVSEWVDELMNGWVWVSENCLWFEAHILTEPGHYEHHRGRCLWLASGCCLLKTGPLSIVLLSSPFFHFVLHSSFPLLF